MGEDGCVTGLEPPVDAGLLRVAGTVGQQCITQRRGQRECDHQRRHNGQDVGHPEWREQLARDAGQAQHRQEDGGDGKCCVYHRASHLGGCVDDNRDGGQRRRQVAVFAQATINVLDVDDGIVHHLAKRDGQSSQRHRIQCHAKVVQYHDGGQQREGDGGG